MMTTKGLTRDDFGRHNKHQSRRRRGSSSQSLRWRLSLSRWLKLLVFVVLGWFFFAIVRLFLLLSRVDSFLPPGFGCPFWTQPRQQDDYSILLERSETPETALVMDAEHFPYPYTINLNRTSTLLSSAPMIVQLRGEMGNHLSTIAHGIGLQLTALQDHNLSTHLLFRHQTFTKTSKSGYDTIVEDNPKWLPTSRLLKRCFPVMKDWDFSLGSRWKEFDRLNREQQERQRHDETEEGDSNMWRQITLVNGMTMVGRKGLDNMKEPVTAQDIDQGLDAFTILWRKIHFSHKHDTSEDNSVLNLPFMVSDSMDNMALLRRHLSVFRRIFRIDPSCCGTERPDPDETVFHFRNFAKEFQTVSRKDGKQSSELLTMPSFEEVSPKQTSTVLFPYLGVGDKVAIVSRFPNDPVLQEHFHALKDRGIRVRIVSDSASGEGLWNDPFSGIQDFCFLLRANRTIVGNFRSTFVFWAALIGDAERVLLYTIKSPGLKARFGPFIKQFFTGTTTWSLDNVSTTAGGRLEKRLDMMLIPMDRSM